MWENSIKMKFREIWCDGVNWVQMAEDRVKCSGVCEHESLGSVKVGNFLTNLVAVNMPRKILHLGFGLLYLTNLTYLNLF